MGLVRVDMFKPEDVTAPKILSSDEDGAVNIMEPSEEVPPV